MEAWGDTSDMQERAPSISASLSIGAAPHAAPTFTGAGNAGSVSIVIAFPVNLHGSRFITTTEVAGESETIDPGRAAGDRVLCAPSECAK